MIRYQSVTLLSTTKTRPVSLALQRTDIYSPELGLIDAKGSVFFAASITETLVTTIDGSRGTFPSTVATSLYYNDYSRLGFENAPWTTPITTQKPTATTTHDLTTTDTTTTTTKAPPRPKPYYDCEGEELCSTTNVKYCDLAVNHMQRGDRLYQANTGLIADEGNCWANRVGFGCSVRIRGTDRNGLDCTITGDDMWNAYQDIRNTGGCGKCGSKHFGNGCLVSIDYDYGCDNRSGDSDFAPELNSKSEGLNASTQL